MKSHEEKNQDFLAIHKFGKKTKESEWLCEVIKMKIEEKMNEKKILHINDNYEKNILIAINV